MKDPIDVSIGLTISLIYMYTLASLYRHLVIHCKARKWELQSFPLTDGQSFCDCLKPSRSNYKWDGGYSTQNTGEIKKFYFEFFFL